MRWLSGPFPFPFPMALDHERFEVYQAALELFDLIDEIVEQLPRGRGHLADQLSRAGLSIVNNIAEGAGKFSPGDKRRYYLAGKRVDDRVCRDARCVRASSAHIGGHSASRETARRANCRDAGQTRSEP